MPTRIDKLPMKCTLVDPRYNSGFEIGMTAGEIINDQSGKFVILNATTGYGEIAANNETPLAGWADLDSQTTASPNGTTKAWCIDDLNAKFVIPLKYDNSTYTVNYAESLKNELCDLVVISNIQYLNPTLSSYDQVIIVDGKACTSASSNDGFAIVKLSPNRTFVGTID